MIRLYINGKKILNQNYDVYCEENEREMLMKSAELLNDKMMKTKAEGKTVVNFRDLANFDQNYKLLDNLPTQIIANISDFMTDVRSYKDTIFFYENDDEKEVPLDVDIGLFAGI